MASGIEESLADFAKSSVFRVKATEEEIDKTVEIIVECAKKLRAMSSQLLK